MAIQAEIQTQYGETRECYVRLITAEANNHGAKTPALFRAFLSEEAFESGAHYVAEFQIEFDADVSQLLWEQAYDALKASRQIGPSTDI